MTIRRIAATTFLLALAVFGCRCAKEGAGSGADVPAPVIDEPGAKVAAKKPAKSRVIRGPEGIEIFVSKPEVLAALEVVGMPYAEMGVAIGKLARSLEAQGVKTLGYSRAIYLEDPAVIEPSEYRYHVAFPVEAEAALKSPVERLALPAREYARVTHRGDYDESYQVRCFERVPRAIAEMGYAIEGPIHEIYRFTDLESDAARWVTEVRYPVRKARKKTPDHEKRERSSRPRDN